MIRVIGGALLLCGSILSGWIAAGRLDARVGTIRQMLAAIQTIRRELAFSLTSVPCMIERLETQTKGPLHLFFNRFQTALHQLGTKSMGELWNETLQKAELPIQPEERNLFATLGEVLGRYDGEGQETYFSFLTEELERCQRAAEEERNRMGKVYRVLGVTVGGFLIVLLF